MSFRALVESFEWLPLLMMVKLFSVIGPSLYFALFLLFIRTAVRFLLFAFSFEFIFPSLLSSLLLLIIRVFLFMLWNLFIVYVACVTSFLVHYVGELSVDNLKALFDEADLLIHNLVLQILHSLGFQGCNIGWVESH